ncbi:hypothetical protein M8818_005586 [Zalaria obscura]|uniref:Uncharacterized protein n=1 Tax=Zalaria obscura TaxID=2024903 RepID=A0ACC3S8Z3_9PEZI
MGSNMHGLHSMVDRADMLRCAHGVKQRRLETVAQGAAPRNTRWILETRRVKHSRALGLAVLIMLEQAKKAQS